MMTVTPHQKTPLTGMTLEELESLLGSRARAVAVLRWLHEAPLTEALPDALPGVAASAWAKLVATCELPRAGVRERQTSADGTTKFLVELDDTAVESVLIPARGRSTVCLSSQSGCTRRCAFCATAKVGFKRQLTAAEIVAQYRIARAAAPADAPARNVVFMGMGEPLDNLDEVLRAVVLLTQAPAPQLGAEQVTVSTSGVVPAMRRFLRESTASLAVSLNATTDEQRTALMPHNRTWPIASLLEVLREDAEVHPRRVHFIEYVLFEGLNDSDADADRLGTLLKGLRARVNLIPHNGITDGTLRPPTHERILEFQKRLRSAGPRCLVRWPRGREIAAACGQLALTSRAG